MVPRTCVAASARHLQFRRGKSLNVDIQSWAASFLLGIPSSQSIPRIPHQLSGPKDLKIRTLWTNKRPNAIRSICFGQVRASAPCPFARQPVLESTTSPERYLMLQPRTRPGAIPERAAPKVGRNTTGTSRTPPVFPLERRWSTTRHGRTP